MSILLIVRVVELDERTSHLGCILFLLRREKHSRVAHDRRGLGDRLGQRHELDERLVACVDGEDGRRCCRGASTRHPKRLRLQREKVVGLLLERGDLLSFGLGVASVALDLCPLEPSALLVPSGTGGRQLSDDQADETHRSV